MGGKSARERKRIRGSAAKDYPLTGVYTRLPRSVKGQVIRRRLERIYRGSSRGDAEEEEKEEEEERQRFAFPIERILGVGCAKETATGAEKDRDERSRQSRWKVKRLSSPERSKSKELVITKRMLSYGFLIRIQFKAIRPRDSPRGELASSRTIEFLGHWFFYARLASRLG